MSKIYVGEQHHDNACGVFSTSDAAIAHMKSCKLCEAVIELELIDGAFMKTGESWTPCRYSYQKGFYKHLVEK